MDISSDLTEYTHLAEQFATGKIAENDLPALTKSLPSLEYILLDSIVAWAEHASLTRPRLGWCMLTIGEAACEPTGDDRLSAQAAWYLARAANDWVEPQRVETAVQRAKDRFRALEDTAWMAACDWQRYALPWTRSDHSLATGILAQALDVIEQSNIREFAPHCRLSLAYAQILQGNHLEAEDNIHQSEQAFITSNNLLEQAHCWLHMSSSLRRRGKYTQALDYLKRAINVFEPQDALLDLARTYYQLAMVHWRMKSPDLNAEAVLHQASEIFRSCEVPLWDATCQGALALVYNDSGQLREARLALDAARDVYQCYDTPGLAADNLLDSGRLEMFRGNLQASSTYLTQAIEIYNRLGYKAMGALARIYLGQTSSLLGRYFQALQNLEQAQEILQSLNLPERLAECEMQLASIWIRLGRADQAHRLLDRAEQYFTQTEQTDFLISIYNRRADAFFLAQKEREAVECLHQGLASAQQAGGKQQIAVALRLLGDALLNTGKADEALAYLQNAAGINTELDMRIDLAACQTSLGRYYFDVGDYVAAESAWQSAIILSEGIAQDITWQAQAGLAEIYQVRGNNQQALYQLQNVIHTLSKMRRALWQPDLAGSYLQRRAPLLDRTIRLAAETGTAADTLQVIEESKAQTLGMRLAAQKTENQVQLPPEAQDLAAEIHWLQECLQTSGKVKNLISPEQADLIVNLRQKNRLYDELLSRLERQRVAGSPYTTLDPTFDASHFVQLVSHSLQQNWVAIDYYLSRTHLFGVVLAHDQSFAWQSKITPEIEIALRVCGNAIRNASSPTDRDLNILGNWLFPLGLQVLLHPQTTLIISPHRQLHQIPWPALRIGEEQQVLVTACIPVITPSLNSLASLLEHSSSNPITPCNGFVLAIAQFQGRHNDLPQVRNELGFLSSRLCPGSQVLANEDGNWEKLKLASRENGLKRFEFWHIASHAFHDPLTGRLSGLALYDRDLWLDDLWDLAPLPGLVTLSACNGTQSLLHAGDEPIGLAVLCLSAGARQVVGSLWPILDEAASGLTTNFYTNLWQGKRPAQALAEAQRAMLNSYSSTDHWGGYLCIGSPV